LRSHVSRYKDIFISSQAAVFWLFFESPPFLWRICKNHDCQAEQVPLTPAVAGPMRGAFALRADRRFCLS
jgi:hypothetical protein